MENIVHGLLRGTGAAINVPIGFIPDLVIVTNLTDGNKITIGHPSMYLCAFTSGGTSEVKKGMLLTGNTSGATGRVAGVILDTGSWAGGDAAGWIIIDPVSIVGTFAGETAYIPGGSNDITLSAALESPNVDIDTEVADATGNAAISAYLGSSTSGSEAAKGFTVGSTVSTDAKLLSFVAMRGGPGSAGKDVYNSA